MDVATTLLGLGLAAMAITLLIGIVCYVIASYAHMKALAAMGYEKAWLAWIPFASSYACADAAANGQDPVELFGSFSVPAMVFKLWWIAPIILNVIPLASWIITVLNIALNIVFLGSIYTKMYAALENKPESETQVIGCVSGFLPIVAVFKFLFMK